MKVCNSGADRYTAPNLRILEIKDEGILCASGEKWYEKEGQGDFNFGLETDDTWV